MVRYTATVFIYQNYMHSVERQPPTGQTQLPIPRTSFVGRRREIAAVKRLLAQHRLVTLTGSGGGGKTRLALQVAADLLPAFPGGVCWVDLAALDEAAMPAQSVAAALDLRELPGRSPIETIGEQLAAHNTLLVLDNCEHLAPACAEFLNRLSELCPAAQVLSTSRAPLRAANERVWQVPLLELPAPDADARPEQLGRVESVRLFVERARTVAPGFVLSERNAATVALICRRLEGLPLAIELAAARSTVMTPREIAERLDNSLALLTRASHGSDARHTMLRAAIAWSYDLLAPAEQALFVRLAAFSGGFDLPAVEGVCAGAGLEGTGLLDLLASLVEASLLVTLEQADQMRYRLLEPIRHFAVEQLERNGDGLAWRERHAAYYLGLVQRASARLRGNQPDWLELLDREHDNALAALSWCATAGCVETGLRLGSELHQFWQLRGYFSLGQRWLAEFLALADGTIDVLVHARAVLASARLYSVHSDFPASRAQYEQALALAQRAEDDACIETAMIGLGGTLTNLGDFRGARGLLEAAVALCRQSGHTGALASALGNLGLVHQWSANAAEARACHEEALVHARAAGDRTVAATTTMNLALVAEQNGDYAGARLYYHEALDAHLELGDRSRAADTLLNLGQLEAEAGEFQAGEAHLAEAERLYLALTSPADLGYVAANRGDIAFYQGNYARAQAQYQQALALFRTAGNQRLVGRSLGMLGYIAVRAGRLKDAAELCADALTLRREIGHQAGLLFSLDRGYIELALALGRPVVAARLAGAVEAAREALHRPRTPLETEAAEQVKQQLHAQLGAANFLAVANQGRGMRLEQAAGYALDSLNPSSIEQAAPELRIFALGPLRVYRGDRLLSAADWTYAKARELVLLLIFQPHATREQIGAEFWPDASTEQVRQRFSAALAHARGALGRDTEWISLDNGRYSFNRARPVWIDVDAFEGALFEAQLLLRSGSQNERAAGLLAEAVALYSNDFACDVHDGDWHTARREALRHAYLEALMALGRLHEAAGRDEQAIAVWQRALAADAYLEEAHHELIKLYARSGKRRLALAQFEKLEAALDELHAVPSPETTALVRSLKHNDPL